MPGSAMISISNGWRRCWTGAILPDWGGAFMQPDPLTLWLSPRVAPYLR